MTDPVIDGQEQYDVIVVGSGPAGLSAATELKRRGVPRVAVFEREPVAGGIPRHCHHSPFGMREFTRILNGPQYTKKLAITALSVGVELRLSTSVVEAKPRGKLTITSNNGLEEISAKRIVIATGVRETPRSARLISGARPLGIANTGALQSMAYLANQKPFERPIIVGTELVSFSAIQTCRHANIQPVAMLEPSAQVIARWPISAFARFAGVPIHLNSRLIEIKGDTRTTAVIIEDHTGARQTIDCDGVIMTGQFTPDAPLARSGHLDMDIASGGPRVDQFGRCSDPAYYAAGNILRPVETAGWSWKEGKQVGRWIAKDLAEGLPTFGAELSIATDSDILKLAVPQKICLPLTSTGMRNLQLRFTKPATGTLSASCNNKVIFEKRMNVLPERRFLIPLKKLVNTSKSGLIEIRFHEEGE